VAKGRSTFIHSFYIASLEYFRPNPALLANNLVVIELDFANEKFGGLLLSIQVANSFVN
jgi:hypothetical protein